MNRKSLIAWLGLLVAAVLLAACGASPEPGDAAARRSEIEIAVAATLTASAPTRPGETQVALVPTDTPGRGDGPASTETPTAIDVDVPPPTIIPTTAPPPATPTVQPLAAASPTPVVVAVLPVDGGGGDILNIRNANPVKDGRNVTLPGFAPAEVTEPMTFRDRMVFQVEVFDANVGTEDGAGIDNVRFTITDDRGQQVYFRQENNQAYCVFAGGEPDCNVWVFAQSNYRWPDGARLFPGLYNVTIDIQPTGGDTVQWFWSFQVELPQDAARIDGIVIRDGYYAVAFETFGFTPELPGQHVHFFFDTVPAEQAGVPGSGPWKLYGGPSPFVEYGPGDRPPGATQMCVLVANADHSVQANTGNCFPLP